MWIYGNSLPILTIPDFGNLYGISLYNFRLFGYTGIPYQFWQFRIWWEITLSINLNASVTRRFTKSAQSTSIWMLLSGGFSNHYYYFAVFSHFKNAVFTWKQNKYINFMFRVKAFLLWTSSFSKKVCSSGHALRMFSK